MSDVTLASNDCPVRRPVPQKKRERGVLAVVVLTAAMMAIEIAVGYISGSMALLADGWHMATHVGALGLAAGAYALSRRYASHRAFAFGTGKIHALAGYTSAMALGFVAAAMIVESAARLFAPRAIDFASAVPVAVVGLVVNILSVFLLHDDHDHDHDHDHEVDHNHRAALMHVVADTLTSALAIAALVAGRFLGWLWLDAATGIAGGLVILKWGVELCRSAAFELLGVETSPALEDKIRDALEQESGATVSDLHVWSLGSGARSCVVTLVATAPMEAQVYRDRLAPLKLAHLTIEVRRREPVEESSMAS